MNGIVAEIRDSLELAGLVGRLTPAHVATCLITALFCGLLIYIVYKLFYRGAVYSESFNILNMVTCMITAFIIMTISANIVLSLGMVGALSIVRFRAAIKDPLDIGFLFLAVSAGLTSGAGLFPLAVIGTVSILMVYVVVSAIGNSSKTFLLVIKHEDASKDAVREAIKPYSPSLKSAICHDGMTELTLAVKVRGIDSKVLDAVRKIDGVVNAVLMEYVGD